MTYTKTDVLVVGSGLAGTLFSLELAKRCPELGILMLSKKDKNNSSSYLAQGGIAAVLPDTEDTMEQHIEDTLAAGSYSNNKAVVDYFVSKSPEAIRTLEEWNVSFDSNAKGSKALALEGGHSLPRVLHHKDFTGKHIMEKLHSWLEKYPNVRLLEGVELFELIKTGTSGTVTGAWAWDYSTNKAFTIQASAVVLSTGGVGGLFQYTTNPSTATGQGIAMAEKAGAVINDIINIQFHPTAFWKPEGSHLPLISEALRGAGAVLRNESGHRFMAGQHPLNDLAPRDVVARSIVKELERQNLPYVYLDGTSIDEKEWENHFPGILKICEDAGVDPRKEWIPVVPAAHYSCGGIRADVNGRTDVENLFVVGESASTGLHGANRLASNSLLEAAIMAIGLAEDIAAGKIQMKKSEERLPAAPELTMEESHDERSEKYLLKIKEIMQQYCSVVKTTTGLKLAEQGLSLLEEDVQSALPPQSFFRINLLLAVHAAKRIVEKSLEAKENKGVFYNQDLAGIYQ